VNLDAVIEGWLDAVEPMVSGWAFDRASPSTPAVVEIQVDGVPVGLATCDIPRPDVKEASGAPLKCGFVLKLPLSVFDGDEHVVRAFAASTGDELKGSPIAGVLGRPQHTHGDPWEILDRDGDDRAFTRRVEADRRVSVVACYRPPGAPTDWIADYVTALQALGGPVLVVDTSADAVPASTCGADLVLHRTNAGWDFASWIVGMSELGAALDNVDRLVLTNDSAFAPLQPLQPMFDSAAAAGLQVWGATDSWQHEWHLQSYFLVLSQAAVGHAAFRSFVREYPMPSTKWAVVRRGELGFTRAFTTTNLELGAVFPYTDVARAWASAYDSVPAEAIDQDVAAVLALVRRRFALNPTHAFWDTLIEQFGSPFLKRELVVGNDSYVPTLSRLREVLGRLGVDPTRVERGSRHYARGRVPLV
jgi:hypothetical protein